MEDKIDIQITQDGHSTGLSSYTEAKYLIPEVDIAEDKEKIYYLYQLPGIDTQSLNVELSDKEIFIQANSETKEGMQFVHQERIKGEYFRKLPLPSNGDSDLAEADLKKGLLEIAFPKRKNYQE